MGLWDVQGNDAIGPGAGGRRNITLSRISGCTTLLDWGIGGKRGLTETVGLACGAPATTGVKRGGRADIWDAGRRVVPEEPRIPSGA